MKIAIALLALAVCAEATVPDLLGLLKPKPKPPTRVFVPVYQPVHYYHQLPVAPAPIVRVIQPVYYYPRPTYQQVPQTVAPQIPTVEITKSEGTSFSLPPEQVTVEKTVSPVEEVEVTQDVVPALAVDGGSETGGAEDQSVAAIASAGASASADASAFAEASASAGASSSFDFGSDQGTFTDDEPTQLLDGPINVVSSQADTSVVELAHDDIAALPLAPQEVATPHVEATPQVQVVALDQEEIHRKIVEQAIPTVIDQVAPQLIEQAIKQVVDRVVPQIVQQTQQHHHVQHHGHQQHHGHHQQHQVHQQPAQQIHTEEHVHVVTPMNHQHQQIQDEKVHVMYATSVPEQTYDGFNLRVQDEPAAAVPAKPLFTIEKSIAAGDTIEQEVLGVGAINQQIIENFQRENLALKQQQQQIQGASAFANANANSVVQIGGGLNQQNQQFGGNFQLDGNYQQNQQFGGNYQQNQQFGGNYQLEDLSLRQQQQFGGGAVSSASASSSSFSQQHQQHLGGGLHQLHL